MISDRFRRRALNADPAAVGRTLRLNGHVFTIVGIAAEGFTGTDVGSPSDVWLPMMMQQQLGRDLIANARTNWLEIIGRLPRGADRGRVAAELSQVVASEDALVRGGTEGPRQFVLLPGAQGRSVGAEISRSLTTVAALTLLALVLACANVTGLLAVRAAAPEREMAIRLALGARRSHLARQVLVETVVLAAIGGVAALMLWNIMINGGVTLPTGKAERPRFRTELEDDSLVPLSRLQRGTGTIDPLLGISVNRIVTRIFPPGVRVFANAAGRVPIAENEFGMRTGATWEIGAGASREIRVHQLIGIGRLSWLHREQDAHEGTPVLVGGGDWIYLAPAAAVSLGAMTIQAEVKLPVYRSLANRQLDSALMFQIGAIWTPF